MVANPSAFNPVAFPSAAAAAAQPGARGHAPAGLHQRQPVRARGSRSRCRRCRHRAARGATGGAVLHELAAAPDPGGDGPRARRSRPGRRVPRLLRRPEDPDDDRPADAAGGPAGDLRRSAERAGRPAASLVAIDNKTGQVRAMVGGPLVDGQEDYEKYPFNLATAGDRQPGSAFKPFTLAVALEHGFTPDSVIDSTALEPDRAQQRRQGALHTSRTSATSTRARSRSPTRPPSRTTACSPRSASRSARSGSRRWRRRWESARRSRPTTR